MNQVVDQSMLEELALEIFMTPSYRPLLETKQLTTETQALQIITRWWL